MSDLTHYAELCATAIAQLERCPNDTRKHDMKRPLTQSAWSPVWARLNQRDFSPQLIAKLVPATKVPDAVAHVAPQGHDWAALRAKVGEPLEVSEKSA
jgi:hypothetical protein